MPRYIERLHGCLVDMPGFLMLYFTRKTDDVKITVDLRKLGKYFQLLTEDSGAFRSMMGNLAQRYRKFAYTRFNRLASGGGEWPPLSRHTKKRVSRGRRRILIDSGTLRDALRPLKSNKQPGATSEPITGGIRIGYGGGAMHPTAGMTIESLAIIHQKGKGKNPKREIIVDPDEETIKLMESDVVDAANKLKRKLGMS